MSESTACSHVSCRQSRDHVFLELATYLLIHVQYMLDVLHWLPTSVADHIPYWCPSLEVYPGSCSGLPPRSVLSHPGHQRSQFTPLIGTGISFCSFCSYHHNPCPCILGGWPLCEIGFLWRNDCSPGFSLTHSTLASKLFFLAEQGSG